MVQTLKTTDGEGVIFDSWADYAYKYQGVLEQSVMWGNGSSGFEYFSTPIRRLTNNLRSM
jgi:hypothetical protein